MSQENLEIVRQALEKWNRGDLDAFVEMLDDDVVLRMAEGWPERVYFGKAAARSFIDGWVETVGGYDTVVEEAIDAGAVVVVRQRVHLSGVQSGIEGDQRSTSIATLREGKVVMLEFFWDHQEALEAAGLRE
jgi:ketosteroid isomerase-like protein